MQRVWDGLHIPVSLRRGVWRGVSRIVREQGWGVSLGALFGLLLLAQCAFVFLAGIDGAMRLIREKTDLRLEITEAASDVQIQDFIQNIRTLPIVEDVTYVTREQAYERMRQKDPELVQFLSTFGIQNPFPETVGVRLRRLDDYDAFVAFLREPVSAAVVDPSFLSTTTDQEAQIRDLVDSMRAAHAAALLGIVLLALVLLFVIVEFLRRRALDRRDELYIEQLVGASRSAMLTPFFIEVLLLLAAALFLATILIAIVVVAFPFILPDIDPQGIFGMWLAASQGELLRLSPLILLTEIFSIILLAILGTAFALRDQLGLLYASRA